MRILIVRLGAMGDVLHAIPAVQRIREAIPGCDIGWAIESRWSPLLCAPNAEHVGATSGQRPLVNRVHIVDTRSWRKSIFSPATWAAVRGVFREIRACHYDLVIDFQGSLKSAVVARLSQAPRIHGFSDPRESLARMFYTHQVSAPAAHVVDQNFELVADLVSGNLSNATPLPVDPAAELWVSSELQRLQLSRFAILAPTAGWAAKEWPSSNFAQVANTLSQHRLPSLINFAPGEERVANDVVTAASGDAHPFFCTVSQLIALTRRAALFIGGDTGPMHLASALGTPVVALFGPTDPVRNGPYRSRSRVLRDPLSVTSYSHVSQSDPGLLNISPAQVIAAAESILE